MSKILIDEDTVKLVLEALKQIDNAMPFPVAKLAQAALREALADQPAQQEPFGYFKAEPFGWTDCAETDEGAVALYTAPQPTLCAPAADGVCESLDCPNHKPAQQDIPDLIAGALGVSRGTAYDMMREALKDILPAQPQQERPSFAEWTNDYVRDNLHKLKPAQQEPVAVGGPVGWHSKQYGFVYMAFQPHQFEVGSTLYLKDGTPAWRIESSCSKTALMSMSSLPHGTVFYTSPPAQRKPLTIREIGVVCGNFSDQTVKVVRQTEAAHNIKENT